MESCALYPASHFGQFRQRLAQLVATQAQDLAQGNGFTRCRRSRAQFARYQVGPGRLGWWRD
jgi:hypothetical protein